MDQTGKNPPKRTLFAHFMGKKWPISFEIWPILGRNWGVQTRENCEFVGLAPQKWGLFCTEFTKK